MSRKSHRLLTSSPVGKGGGMGKLDVGASEKRQGAGVGVETYSDSRPGSSSYSSSRPGIDSCH